MVSPSTHAERQGLTKEGEEKSPPTFERLVASPSTHEECQGLKKSPPTCERKVASPSTHAERQGLEKKKKSSHCIFPFCCWFAPLTAVASPGSHAECQGLTVGLAKRGASRQRPFLFQLERPLKAGPTREKMFKDCENQKRYLGPHPKHVKGMKSPCFGWKSIPRQWEAERGRIRKLGTEEPTGSTLDPAQPPAPPRWLSRVQLWEGMQCTTEAHAAAAAWCVLHKRVGVRHGSQGLLSTVEPGLAPPPGEGERNRGVGGVTGYKGQPEFRIFFLNAGGGNCPPPPDGGWGAESLGNRPPPPDGGWGAESRRLWKRTDLNPTVGTASPRSGGHCSGELIFFTPFRWKGLQRYFPAEAALLPTVGERISEWGPTTSEWSGLPLSRWKGQRPRIKKAPEFRNYNPLVAQITPLFPLYFHPVFRLSLARPVRRRHQRSVLLHTPHRPPPLLPKGGLLKMTSVKNGPLHP